MRLPIPYFLLCAFAGCTPLTVDDRVPTDASSDEAASSEGGPHDGGAGESGARDSGSPDEGAESDALANGDADAGCTPLAIGSAAIYVDAHVAASGTGVAGCPLRTITAALAAASPGATIHVAAGTYDAALGEVFPMVVRGVSIVGAGAPTTTVRGRGSCPVLNVNGPIVSCDALLVVGHETLTTTVTSIAFTSAAGSLSGNYGVLCDRGNAPATRGARTAANTVFNRTTFGPAFEVGILATTSGSPSNSACNLSVVGSTFQGGQLGVWAAGDSKAGFRPALQIGDGTMQGGVAFSGHRSTSREGIGVSIWDDVGSAMIRNSTFASSDEGIVVVQHHDGSPWLNHFEITGNQFSGLSYAGIHVAYAAVVDVLSDNTFNGVSAPGGAAAAALLLNGLSSPAPWFPAVRRARTNSFVGNDVAIEFRGPASIGTLSTPNDFGTTGDPGGNIFRCNAGIQGTSGFDLLVGASASGGALTLPFFGNMWDHSPPTSSGAANGTDLRVTAGAPPSIDVGGATLAIATCPAGRQP